MVFSKFSQPKWQHQDPSVRTSAIEELDDFSVLNQLAQQDEAATVRQAAIAKVEDLTLLKDIAERDVNEDVRTASQQRFQEVLCGQKQSQISLTERLHEFNQTSNADLIAYVAKNGVEPQLRLTALNRISDENFISEMAIHDPAVKVRLAAVAKLTQESSLEYVFKTLKNKDKRVSRAANEKLNASVQRVERLEKVKLDCQEICEHLENLSTRSSFGRQEHTELMQLQVRWESLEKEAESLSIPLETARYQHALDTLHQREQALKTLQNAKQNVCDRANALLIDVQSSYRDAKNVDDFSRHLNDLQAEWQSIPPCADESEESQWQSRFKKINDSIDVAYKLLKAERSITHALETICKDAENLLTADAVRIGDIKNLKKQWLDSPKNVESSDELITELTKRFDKVISALKAKLEHQSEKRDEYLEKLDILLKEGESALEKGELQVAISAEKEARNLFRKIGDLPAKQQNALDNRFQVLSSKIKDLRSWQRWGNNRERENLCQAMEDLIKQKEDISLEKKAQLIREAQEKWKKLDSRASAGLWRRFSKACDTAYEPCKVYFEQKAQERKENVIERENICSRLEAFSAEIDWNKPDWKKVFNTVRDIDKAWRNAGPIDRKLRKSLAKRFDNALKIVQDHLDEERKQNLEWRENLIEKVKEAQKIEDLTQAIETVKKLQPQWEVTVPSTHRAERELWKDFHTACDVVFDRRRQEFRQSDAERQANLDAKDKICKEIELLSHSTEKSKQILLSEFNRLKAEWNAVGEIPRKVSKGAEKHFSKVCQQFEKAYRVILTSARREQMEKLREKALICLTLEQAKEKNESDIAQAQAKWESIGVLTDSRLEKAVERRFKKACEVMGQLPNVEKSLKEKEILCIHMEILAGIDSPPESTRARMAYQVERLTKAMGERNSEANDKFKEVLEIEEKWYTSSWIEDEKSAILEQRFNKALEAFRFQK